MSETFFIPESIRSRRLSSLPHSQAFATAMRRLQLRQFGDLAVVTWSHFRQVSDDWASVIQEASNLIEQARIDVLIREEEKSPPADVVSPAGMADGQASGTPGSGASPAGPGEIIQDAPVETSAMGQTGAGTWALGGTERTVELHPTRIIIPMEALDRPLPIPPAISVRLAHVFQAAGLLHFRDLDGREFYQFLKLGNFGKKSLEELRRLICAVQCRFPTIAPLTSAAHEPNRTPPGLHDGVFNVPPSAYNLNLCDLPMTTRLANVFEMRGMRVLSDANGLSALDFRRALNCGKKTTAEISRLIERASAGEFTPIAPEEWSPVALLEYTDSLLGALPDRARGILAARFEGTEEEGTTLAAISATYGISRERVRQIIMKTIDALRKNGAGRLQSFLQRLESECATGVFAVTPALVAHWIRTADRCLNYTPPFYVRLLAALAPDLPVWLVNGRQPPRPLAPHLEVE